MPDLLEVPKAHTYGLFPSISQAVVLLSASEEVKTEVLGHEKAYLHRLANAYLIEQSLKSPIGDFIPESQLRPLLKVEPDKRQEVWEDAEKIAFEEGKRIGAKHVQAAADEWKQKFLIADKNLNEVCDQLETSESMLKAEKDSEPLRVKRAAEELNKKILLESKNNQDLFNAANEQNHRLVEVGKVKHAENGGDKIAALSTIDNAAPKHKTKKGGGVRAYAAEIGKGENSLKEWIAAASVYEVLCRTSGTNELHNKTYPTTNG